MLSRCMRDISVTLTVTLDQVVDIITVDVTKGTDTDTERSCGVVLSGT